METIVKEKKLLGINGLGRIGKLTLWYHLQAGYFNGAVINLGREAGNSLDDAVHAILNDSTYGTLDHFLFGYSGRRLEVKTIDAEQGLLDFDGFMVKIMRRERMPRNIGWVKEGVGIVVDCTGKFLDPTIPSDHPKGSLKGHLESGARKVIVSAPFKIKDKAEADMALYPTLIYGINHVDFQPRSHEVVSAASCTTTGLAHMMKPLLEDQETMSILTASMSTVHAATNTQNVLDAMPSASTTDLRKNRAVFNNIILSSTGAGKALEKVLPVIANIGFMADSVRIPTTTVSLISLNITFNTRTNDLGEPVISGQYINNLYRMAAKGPQKDLLHFSEKQNVSSDLIGFPAAVVIEGHETHTRTGFIALPATLLRSKGIQDARDLSLPVTHAKIFGWYDNEYGSYVRCLGKLTEYMDAGTR